MKLNKFFIITVLLVVVFSLASVSAQNTTETTVNEALISEGNFDELSSLIQNTTEQATLTLEKDYRYESGSTDGILIDKAITIDGRGHTVDGANSSRIFNLYFENYTYKTITFRNLTFANGWHGENGAAIFMHGNSILDDDMVYTANYLVLKDCIFINNHAKTGGAVSCGSVSDISNCNFINNSATSSGGAVEWREGYISNSNFTKNNAYHGGALYYSGEGSFYSSPYASVSGCIFDANTASYAGAICGFNGRYQHTLSVSDSLFTNNVAEVKGGALLWYGSSSDVGTGYISGCTFRNNSAQNGGALNVAYCSNVKNCTFEDNHAKKGGALFADVSEYSNEKAINCTFTHNFADEGAATYATFDEYKIINCTYDNNIASANGTVAYGGNLTDCKFTNSSFKPVNVKIIASSVTTVYNGGKYLVINLKDENDNPIKSADITVSLNGKVTPLKTNSAGQAKLTTDGLAPKTSYVATITFGGNASFKNATKTVKVTVKKATPKLTASKKTFKRTVKTKKYTVTLKTNQNKVMKNTKVTLKLNKKTFTAKTNAKGQATFKITKLTKKGTYKATVKYAGNKYYSSKTVNTKITCK